jgi:ketosteroid isomerase-like protein
MTDAEFVSFVKALDQCWVQGRLQDLTSYLADDVVFVAPGGKFRREGIAYAIESYRRFTEQARIDRFETWDYFVAHRGDAAIVDYVWDMAWAAGGAEHQETGRDILVLAHRNENWRVVWRTQVPAAN